MLLYDFQIIIFNNCLIFHSLDRGLRVIGQDAGGSNGEWHLFLVCVLGRHKEIMVYLWGFPSSNSTCQQNKSGTRYVVK